MKKIMLVFVVLTATVLSSNAQTRFGVKAGGNFYTLGGDNVEGENINSKFGLNVGGLVNIPVAKKFKVQPEVVFSIQGTKEDDGGTTNLNFNYLNIPIMAQVYVTDGFYVEAGPQVGILLKADIKEEGSSSYSVKDELKGADFALGFGAGYTLPGGFGFNARYNLGLSNILKDTGEGELKNRGFQLGVSFLFGGTKGAKEKK
ncbi:MAG: porin family protein [Chitinophagaceae bacterium]